MLQITGLKLSINSDERKLKKKCAKYLGINIDDIVDFVILKRSLDARKKDNIIYQFNIGLELKNETIVLKRNIKNVMVYNEHRYDIKKISTDKKVAVIGYGPAGMYSAMCLAEAGFNVDVYERGEEIEKRIKSVNDFWINRNLNTESNVQFGEGGAGTFSDGKLTSRNKNIRTTKVLDELILAGAPSEISYVHNPHIGTDKLREVVKNIRNKTRKLGASIYFNTKLENVIIENESIVGIVVNGMEKNYDYVVLAIGHSSRDTFKMLYESGVRIEQKPFAVGFRIEHPQLLINRAQYGNEYNNPRLGPAEYKLTNQANGRGVYTFCMCPGGVVVPSQSEINTVVVNGMSEYARDMPNANSAILVTIDRNDVGDDVFSGVNFQRAMERKAFLLGGKNYNAPVQRVVDFINNKKTEKIGDINPSYKIGTTFANLREIYSDEINKVIVDSLEFFNKRVKSFSLDDAILTGVETRSSSPIRIVRDVKSLMSVNILNLYPCGEGCGYAGGIVSAAVDGIKISEKIIERAIDNN
ncbi:NAD(P)/FAD-dependent oxidoreductase [Mycoplasmatota bacterium zrk1]